MTMTATTEPADDVRPAGRSTQQPDLQRPAPTRRRVAWIGLLLIVVTAIVGTRLSMDRPHAPVISVSHPAAAMPASPAIESAWGIRFTSVILLADGGGVELRYQVIDLNKAAKIHLGDPKSNELPTIVVDGTSSRVTPSSVLMHFHHGDAADGRSYSIVYGNAGGVVRTGEYVSILMKDGSVLHHAQVSD
jgi:hypothetical protein